MVRTSARIAGVTVTPVAFRDHPLLNTVGVHEPCALRTIVEITTESGVSGVGETYGGTGYLERLRRAADDTGCTRRFEPSFSARPPGW